MAVDQITKPRVLQPGAELLLGEQCHLQKFLVVALVVHQLAQQLEQRRFQRLRLVDDQHQGFLLGKRLRHQEVFEDVE
jgi:hypothetical protein